MTLSELVQAEAAAMTAAIVTAHMADRSVPDNATARRLEAERQAISRAA